MITSKICSKCNQELSIDNFYFQLDRKTYRADCNNCRNTQRKEYQLLNREKKKQYRLENKERIKISSKEYYEKNKEKIAQYAIENKERISKRQAIYREINREKSILMCREYYIKNRKKLLEEKKHYHQTEKYKIANKNHNHRRRAITKTGDVTNEQLLNLQKNTKVCYWCKKSLKNVKVHIDHYMPLSKGGEHTISNLVVSCEFCNISKNAKDPFVFANKIGRLL